MTTFPGSTVALRTQVPSRPNAGSRTRASLTNTHYITAEHILSTPHGGRVDWSPTNFIAFSKFVTGKYYGEIWTMNPDGTNQVDRTSASGAISHLSNDQPTVRPDGAFIVFQSVDQALADAIGVAGGSTLAEELRQVQGGIGFDNNLWSYNVAAGTVRQLTTVGQGEGVLHAHFSPDGTKLMYSLHHRSGQVPEWEIVLVPFLTDGAGPHLGTPVVYAPLGQSAVTLYETHSFTPDGLWGVFSTDANPTIAQAVSGSFVANIMKIRFSDGVYQALTSTNNVWNEHAQVSPSGNNVVWVSSQGLDLNVNADDFGTVLATDLWRMDIDGSNKQQLTFFNTPGSAQYVAGTRVILSDGSWSPDGLHYVMQRDKFTSGVDTSEVVVFDFSTAQ